ncbi:MAG: D-Ala-D-Ala carboxypeptidase family metallohydrolase [Alistipes sp.]|nr:D-Ala-D-Ala carboxypeptidase family metallohydrolase [Lachnospiraceae bacterium]MCM1250250.1 D-Ala-D-Ala carboxypeptidase family metallohydrolase [Alistipes sp.]
MKHFTMLEFTNSVTARKKGLSNTPSTEHAANIETLVSQLLDPLREAWAIRCAHEQWGTPALNVTSGYRGPELNKAVGGAAASAHCVGFAADLVPANGRLGEFKRFCREYLTGKPFDQMISEDENAAGTPRWVHIGYKNAGGAQRRQLLSKRAGEKGYAAMTV